MNVRIFAAMQKGPRNRQEDCLLVGAEIVQAEALAKESRFNADCLLLAACDGLGGHEAGDRASRFVCSELKARCQPESLHSDAIPLLLKDIQSASRQLLPANCGTTVAGLLVSGEAVHAFNAGDSRIYRIEEKQLRYVSHDHSVVQGLLDNFLILEETAHNHPYKNLIEFGLGPLFASSWQNHSVFLHTEAIEPPAAFLLCSDGLSDKMDADAIHRCLAPNPVENGRALLSAVSEKGLIDNTSFIIVELG